MHDLLHQRKMNLFRKGMIFVTFFGSCFALALLVASLGTKQWLVARAKRTSNPHESDGKIQFGLFDGKRELNVAYGWRTYEINIAETLRVDPDFLIYGLWTTTIACVCAGLFFTVLSAIFAAVNTATTTSGPLSGIPGLYVWNTLALLCDAGAVGCWVAQYYLRLQHNVMSLEDKDNMWTSEGMAEPGYSFWFVAGAGVISLIQILFIYIGTRETRKPEPIITTLEEKTNGAIMLY